MQWEKTKGIHDVTGRERWIDKLLTVIDPTQWHQSNKHMTRNKIFKKIILTITTNTEYSNSYDLHQKYFSYFSRLANSRSVKGTMSKLVLWRLALF